METAKPAKHKASSSGTNFTKYLPRATTFTVPSRPFSPGRGSTASADSSRPQHAGHSHAHGHGHGHGGGHHHRSSFSGPISIIPVEARQRRPEGFGRASTAEPTSPKVSCMGQVKKHKDAAAKAKEAAKKKQQQQPPPTKAKHTEEKKKPAADSGGAKKPPKFAMMKFLRTKSSRSRSEEDKGASAAGAAAGSAPAPSLGQLRRFSSGRSALAGFDWKSGHVAPVDLESPVLGQGGDDDDGIGSYGMAKRDDDDECRIPYSAPMVLGGGIGGFVAAGEPKKCPEVNLWKRRTMPPPKPLQLNV